MIDQAVVVLTPLYEPREGEKKPILYLLYSVATQRESLRFIDIKSWHKVENFFSFWSFLSFVSEE